MKTDPVHQELRTMREVVIIQAWVVWQAVVDISGDLTQGDSARACLVITRESTMKTTQSAIESICLRIIGLQTSDARHRRELIILERVGKELELIDQRAVRIARQVVHLKYREPSTMTLALDVLAYLVREQVEESIRVFTKQNIERARSLPARQEAIEAQWQLISQELECVMLESSRAACARGLLLAANELVGIGEHATRISEIIYPTSGKIVTLA